MLSLSFSFTVYYMLFFRIIQYILELHKNEAWGSTSTDAFSYGTLSVHYGRIGSVSLSSFVSHTAPLFPLLPIHLFIFKITVLIVVFTIIEPIALVTKKRRQNSFRSTLCPEWFSPTYVVQLTLFLRWRVQPNFNPM